MKIDKYVGNTILIWVEEQVMLCTVLDRLNKDVLRVHIRSEYYFPTARRFVPFQIMLQSELEQISLSLEEIMDYVG